MLRSVRGASTYLATDGLFARPQGAECWQSLRAHKENEIAGRETNELDKTRREDQMSGREDDKTLLSDNLTSRKVEYMTNPKT